MLSAVAVGGKVSLMPECHHVSTVQDPRRPLPIDSMARTALQATCRGFLRGVGHVKVSSKNLKRYKLSTNNPQPHNPKTVTSPYVGSADHVAYTENT